ncbi:retrograde regulation protein 2 [Dimargaris cristalligena]|nr:retrograde regulation protein 2 [Dimargaris cristalligena]
MDSDPTAATMVACPVTLVRPPFAIVDMGSNGIRLGIYGFHQASGNHGGGPSHLTREEGALTSLRHFPVLYRQRAPISLSAELVPDPADPSKRFIPEAVIQQVVDTFTYFQAICTQFRVQAISIVATEATRVATNRLELINRIREATRSHGGSGSGGGGEPATFSPVSSGLASSFASTTVAAVEPSPVGFQYAWDPAGWLIQTIASEQESYFTSLGIQSGFTELDGFTMDLGGGSLELAANQYEAAYSNDQEAIIDPIDSFLSHPLPEPATPSNDNYTDDGQVPVDQFYSFPYGAAVLTQRLDANPEKKVHQKLASEILTAIQSKADPVAAAAVTAASTRRHKHRRPRHRQNATLGRNLYLSGGGFRALAYIAIHTRNEPIPIVHGYSLSRPDFLELVRRIEEDKEFKFKKLKQIPGISKRRAKMIPAVCFLVRSLEPWLSSAVDRVYFSESGVQQGVLATLLSAIPRPGADIGMLASSSSNSNPANKEEEEGLYLQRQTRALGLAPKPTWWSWDQDPLVEAIRAIRTARLSTSTTATDPPQAWIAALRRWIQLIDYHYHLLSASATTPAQSQSHPLTSTSRALWAALTTANLVTSGDANLDSAAGLALFAGGQGSRTVTASAYPVLASGSVSLTPAERACVALVLYNRYGGDPLPADHIQALGDLVGEADTARCVALGRILQVAFTVAPVDWSIVASGQVTLWVRPPASPFNDRDSAKDVSLTAASMDAGVVTLGLDSLHQDGSMNYLVRNTLVQKVVDKMNDAIAELKPRHNY